MRSGTKAAVAVVVVFAAVGGVGMFLGSSSTGLLETNSDSQNTQNGVEAVTETATPAATATATPTERSTATPTATPGSSSGTQETAEPQRAELNETAIEQAILAEINERRQGNLQTDTRTSAQLNDLAGSHSTDMADSTFLAHNVGEGNSADRYKDAGLYEQCEFQVNEYVANADRNQLEAIGRVDIENHRGFDANATERNIAEAIVDDWFSSSTYRQRLTYDNAEYLGAGVAISTNDRVYATANVC